MKIAVTGAGGFLGTEILRQISSRQDITVYAFTFDFERKRETFVHADNIVPVDNSEAGAFYFSDIDVLLNCAFPRNVDDESFAAGLDFIQCVFDKASADHIGAIVNISSQSVYSQKRKEPADETDPIVLETKYAVGKYMSELFVNSLFKDVRHTNLRLSSLIGAGFNQRITNKFAAKIMDGEQITITGGQQIFGFLDVRDAANAIIRLLTGSELVWEETYNIGPNRAYTLLEIAECAQKVGKEMGYPEHPLILVEGGAWQNSAVICDRFYNEFNWKPHYDLENTIKNIFIHLNNHSTHIENRN